MVVLLQDGAADEGSAPIGCGRGRGCGGAGVGAGAAAKLDSRKGKCGSSGRGKCCASKKSKAGAAASAGAPDKTEVLVADNGDGTYFCSYTPPAVRNDCGRT